MCECDCKEKNQIITTGNLLKKGQTQSCGCLQKEIASKIGKSRKKYNKYDLSGEYGIGYTSKGKEFYFDLEDYDKIKDYYWRKNGYGYIITHDFSDDFKNFSMHRLIMDFPDRQFDIDHKHGKESINDNRKTNLRIVTFKNCYSKSKYYKYRFKK